ncbi:MAG: T9SS type A sorting domain-containing protein [Candidatus Kapabacteria bacterium]|nr:T9SS type A sorting domain-containing protein [Candidatus Kapabacteria bacterium]
MLLSAAKRFLIVVAVILHGIIATQSVYSQRTVDLSIKSQTTIDACGDRSLVITIEPGELYAADSVLLYDLALKYDRNLLRFEQVLTVGTMSENLEQKGFNSKDTTQLRVFGFNVLRPIFGNGKPLVGLLFTFRGSCTDTTSKIEIVSEPDINAEAKIRYGKLGSFTIPVTILQKPERTLEVRFSKDSILLVDNQSIFETTMRMSFLMNAGLTDIAIPLKHDVTMELVGMTTSVSDTAEIIKEDSTTTRIVYKRKNGSSLQPPVDIQLRFAAKGTGELKTNLRADSVSYTKCACVTRTSVDTLHILRTIIISVGDEQESHVSLHTTDEFIDLHSETGTNAVKIYSLIGELLWSTTMVGQTHTQIDWSAWSKGVYILRTMTSGGNKDIMLYK